ncbi:MAG: chaperonin GroEL, partial [Candidatus Binatia bacterium]
MPAKTLTFSTEARAGMLRGVNLLADAVAITVGPKGRSVLLERRFGPPVVSRDGFTVAREIDLDDRLRNAAAHLVKEIATRTHDVAGDGTSTATLLARTIFGEGVQLVAAGHDPMSLKRGVEKGVTALLGALERLSRPVRGPEELARVATISANDDREIGDVVARALERVGKEGVVSVENGRGLQTELKFVEGMQIDHGWTSPAFVTDPARMEAFVENALVFVYDGRLSDLGDVVPVLALASRAKRPLFVIADSVEGQALQTLVVNKQRGVLGCVAVRGPATADKRRELLGDVAATTGARVMGAELGLSVKAITEADLGRARQVVVERGTTTIIDGGGRRADIDVRVSYIRGLVEKASEVERERLE